MRSLNSVINLSKTKHNLGLKAYVMNEGYTNKLPFLCV